MAEKYQQSLLDRIAQISDLGTNATDLLRQRMAARQAPELDPYSGPQAQYISQQNPGGGFGAFLRAVSGQESGGNYGARNADSGAMGKYQIMPANIQGSSGWDIQALGRDINESQFMGSPQLQEAIAQYKLKQYYQRYGPAGAAVAWYAGEGNAQKYVSNPSGWGRAQGNYPSIAAYVQSILAKMGR